MSRQLPTEITLCDPKGCYVENIIDQYAIWRDYQKFYNQYDARSIVMASSGIPCFNYTKVQDINHADSPVVVIIAEGLHSKDWFVQYRRDRHYIILSSADWDVSRANLPISCTNINYQLNLFEAIDQYLSSRRFCFYLDKDYKFEPKPLWFVALVGNVRPERDVLVDMLTANMRYDNFSVRYSGQTLGQNLDHHDVVGFRKGEFDPYTNLLDKYYHNVSQTLPIDIYNQGHVNLVVETLLDLPGTFFLTEKTIKPLLIGMPFIVCATPYFLRNLRDLGFQTYGEIWDESYDDETDLVRRCGKIVDLLNDLPKIDWPNQVHRLQQIRDHNRSALFNLNRLQDKIFHTLESCLSQAWDGMNSIYRP